MTKQPIPNFFIVGAPKCGTTALANYLADHPEVYIGPKELHFFGEDLVFRRPIRYRSAPEYLGIFRNRKEKICGDASVWYLYSSTASEEIYRFNKNAKILAMVRNPIEFLHSQHSQLVENGDEDILSFESALAAEPARKNGVGLPDTVAPGPVQALFYMETTKFSEQLERYFTRFPREQIHIVVYDDFKADTAATYRGVLDFLEIHPEHRPEFRVVNPNRAVKNERLWRFMKFGPPALRQTWRRTVPAPVRGRILRWINQRNLVEQKRPDMHEETRDRLRKAFTPEVERLSKMLGRDLMGWVETRDGTLPRKIEDAHGFTPRKG